MVSILSDASNGRMFCFILESIISDDDVVEGMESFLVSIHATTPSLNIQNESTEVTITDNDGTDGRLFYCRNTLTSLFYSIIIIIIEPKYPLIANMYVVQLNLYSETTSIQRPLGHVPINNVALPCIFTCIKSPPLFKDHFFGPSVAA